MFLAICAVLLRQEYFVHVRRFWVMPVPFPICLHRIDESRAGNDIVRSLIDRADGEAKTELGGTGNPDSQGDDIKNDPRRHNLRRNIQ